MALGQTGQLVVAGEMDRRAGFAGRHALDRGGDTAQRRRQAAHEQGGREQPEEAGPGDGKGEQTGHGPLVALPTRGDDDDSEDGERQDSGDDEADGQQDAERKVEAATPDAVWALRRAVG